MHEIQSIVFNAHDALSRSDDTVMLAERYLIFRPVITGTAQSQALVQDPAPTVDISLTKRAGVSRADKVVAISRAPYVQIRQDVNLHVAITRPCAAHHLPRLIDGVKLSCPRDYQVQRPRAAIEAIATDKDRGLWFRSQPTGDVTVEHKLRRV